MILVGTHFFLFINWKNETAKNAIEMVREFENLLQVKKKKEACDGG